MDLPDFAARFKKALSQYQRFLVISHQRPDGDAVGCTIALGLLLKGLGKNVEIWNDDPLPKKFDFLPGADLWRTSPEKCNSFDVVISVDNANKKRLGRAADILTEVKMWINIDHHISNELFGDLNYVDPASPATGEILFEMAKLCGYPMTKEIATSLFVAISTDTGSFNYPNTTARTFETAAALVNLGLNVGEISKKIYESYPICRFLLMKRVLSRTEFRAKNRISYTWILPEDYQETKATPEDSEGLIDTIRAIEGVVAAIIFEKLDDGRIRLSLRSKEKRVDVNKVAQKFGGGGHPLAAGARLPGDPKDIEQKVLSEIEKSL